ncbi:hypothetical protein MMARV_C049P1, partial [viral metagenome]
GIMARSSTVDVEDDLGQLRGVSTADFARINGSGLQALKTLTKYGLGGVTAALFGAFAISRLRRYSKAQMIRHAPIISAVSEELAREFSPRLMGTACVAEAVINGRRGFNPFPALGLHGINHILSWKKPLGQATLVLQVALHGAFNAYVAAPSGRLTAAPRAIRGVQCPVQSFNSPLRGELEVEVNGQTCSINEALVLLDEDESENVFYPILLPKNWLSMPSHSAKNLLCALVLRVHKWPSQFGEVESSSIRRNAWTELYSLMESRGCFNFTLAGAVDFDQCCAEMGSRGHRLIQAMRDLNVGDRVKMAKTICLKHNETLSSTKEMVDGTRGIKPRAIHNMEPVFHAICTVVAKNMACSFKEHWSPCVFELVPGVVVEVFYGSGVSPDHLNVIGERLLHSGNIVIVVSGDDAAVSAGAHEKLLGFRYMETDFTMADQSQGGDCFNCYHSKVMSKVGCPEEFIHSIRQQCSIPYRSRRGRMTARGSPGFQLPTGVVVTSIMNSGTSASNIIWFLYRKMFENVSIEDTAAELGLDVKYIHVEDFRFVTFLKGWWLFNDLGECVWTPLPSLLCKLGKTMKDPAVLFRGARTNAVYLAGYSP